MWYLPCGVKFDNFPPLHTSNNFHLLIFCLLTPNIFTSKTYLHQIISFNFVLPNTARQSSRIKLNIPNPFQPGRNPPKWQIPKSLSENWRLISQAGPPIWNPLWIRDSIPREFWIELELKSHRALTPGSGEDRRCSVTNFITKIGKLAENRLVYFPIDVLGCVVCRVMNWNRPVGILVKWRYY